MIFQPELETMAEERSAHRRERPLTEPARANED
jgi:hypothetical protein